MPNDKPRRSHAAGAELSSQIQIEQSMVSSNLLPVPSLGNQISRTSVDSAFSGSDISERPFDANNPSHNEGLIRSFGDASSIVTPFSDRSRWRKRLSMFWIANYGAFLVLTSQLFGSLMNISARILETPGAHGNALHPFQILFARQSITTLITTTYCLWSKSIPHFPLGPPGEVRLLLLARGFFGFLGVTGLYMSLMYLPLSEATILTFLAPIGSCYAFSLLLPGETFSKQQQIASFISLIGVIFIARPASIFSAGDPRGGQPSPDAMTVSNSTSKLPNDNPLHEVTSAQRLIAVGVAMMGVVGGIGALTSIRSIGQRVHPLVTTQYFSVWCTFVSLVALTVIPSVKFQLPRNLQEWGLLCLLGVCGFIMQLLLTMGMAYGASTKPTKDDGSSQPQDLETQSGQVETLENALVTDDSHVSTVHRMKTSSGQSIKVSGTKATSMLYTQMLFALAGDKLIFGITPGVWSWLGSGLILLGAIWVAADSGQKSSSARSSDSIEMGRRKAGASKNISKATHEEEVGLLADIEETHSVEDHLPDMPHTQFQPTSSGNRVTQDFR